MSDTNTIYAQLPKFKDKVMYVSSAISKSKIESSYVISSSYKGIVRLSPNNHTIVQEDSTHQLSANDQKNQGLIYSDAIVFDNDALSAKKSQCDITRRMIIASESSGFLVNFRISDKDVEFDNLGVIGIASADSLVIYSSNDAYNTSSFTMNGRRMPILAKSGTASTEQLRKTPLVEDDTQYFDIGDYDERKVKIKDDYDKSFLVYGTTDTKDGSRIFRYKQTKLFIQDLILEALLSLQTIPTGSIHFVPVTAEQYAALSHFDSETHQLPNVNYVSNNKDKGTTNPIIRDFLLCDGRQYYTRDFPELAKILWKEKIQNWYPINDTDTNMYYPAEDTTSANDYTKQDGGKTFRVPDLRHMFIGAVHAYGHDDIVASIIPNTPTISNQDTGSYFPDNLSKTARPYQIDNHRHFVAAGTYSSSLLSSSASFHTEYINNYLPPRSVQDYNILKNIEGGKKVGTMYLTNHPFNLNDYGFNGFSRRITDIPQKNCIGSDSFPAHYFAAIPMCSTLGTKEDNLPAYSIEDNNFSGKMSDSFLSVGKVPSTGAGYELHGHENSPKFFAMLPLIKI